MKETKNINIPPLRYFQLMELVKFYKPFTLLEVGCGNGEQGIQMSEAALSSHNSPVHYIGYDLFEDGDNIQYENDHFWVDPHEQYADITPPENVLLEHDTWTIIHSAPVYQFIDYLNTLGRILTEDDQLLTLESNYRHDIQEGHFSLERKDYFTDELNEVQVEFNLHDGMSWHFITEDGDHFIEEGDDRNRLSRFVTDESKVKPSTRVIEYSTPHGTNTRRSAGNQKDEIFIFTAHFI